ncbi:Hsp70 family protein [Pseudonocardia nigra]|uniref:Hsp70 family protein n=1 Tax=Pseudonocardia nigra TaxID=1921578 RepID=UPI001C5E08A8|nr:Hsp70 family protein [Pseudonocardia nigra]
MGYQLGIDLGTTYTAAAVCRSSDRRWVEPEAVTLGTRNAAVPSVLFVGPDGAVLVGEAAERRALTDPDRVVRQFKRRIGDPTPVLVAGRAWAPEELSARLVRWVVNQVAEREGGLADRIAVTHPASWGDHKKDLLGRALAGQGLTVTFLAEPQAAALHYAAAERVAAGSTIAVYDLGGGTFDAAVVRKGDAGFGLLGRPEGLERLGGVDFDEAVFEHVREGLPGAFDELDETDPAVLSAVARVRRECTEAKEALSSDTEVSIPVLMPSTRGSVRLHRSEFEAMIRPQVEETVSALRAAVVSAGLMPEQLTTVLLVGGSSRIPLVGQLVSEQLGRPVAVDADPKNAIAKGAALAVSPKPTASWPGVAVPPVPAAAGAPVAAMAAPMAPPGRPPRPAFTPPHGMPQAGGPYAPAPPIPPGARAHEPATSLLSGNSPEPTRPVRPAAPAPEWDDEPEPAQRRPAGMLVGVGGVLAVAAVIAAFLLWPEAPSTAGVGPSGGTGTPGVTQVVPTPDEAAPEPAPAGDAGAGDTGAATDGGGGNTGGDAGGGAPRGDGGDDNAGSGPVAPANPDDGQGDDSSSGNDQGGPITDPDLPDVPLPTADPEPTDPSAPGDPEPPVDDNQGGDGQNDQTDPGTDTPQDETNTDGGGGGAGDGSGDNAAGEAPATGTPDPGLGATDGTL